MSNKKLIYKACCEEVVLRKNVIASHVKNAEHQTGKSRLLSREA